MGLLDGVRLRIAALVGRPGRSSSARGSIPEDRSDHEEHDGSDPQRIVVGREGRADGDDRDHND